MLIHHGDLDILLVMHACLFELNVYGCASILCLHTMPYTLVLSYDMNDDDTCVPATHGDGEPPKTLDAGYVKNIMYYFDNPEKTPFNYVMGDTLDQRE